MEKSDAAIKKTSASRGMWAELGLGAKIALLSSAICLAVLGVGMEWGFDQFNQTFPPLMQENQWRLLRAEADSLDAKVEVAKSALAIMAKEEGDEFDGIADGLSNAKHAMDGNQILRNIFSMGLLMTDNQGAIVSESAELKATAGVIRGGAMRAYLQALAAKAASAGERQEGSATGVQAVAAEANGATYPAIGWALPIVNKKGSVIGAIAGAIDLLGPSYAGSLATSKVGKHGYFYMAGMDRTMLMHPDTARIMKQATLKGANKGLDSAFDDGFEGVVETTNSTGVNVFAGFIRLKSFRALLAANHPVDEALSPLRKALKAMALTLVFSVLTVLSLVWWMATRLLSPIASLGRHLEQVASGKALAWRERKGAGREERSIGDTYNRMLGQLAEEEIDLQQAQQNLCDLNANLEARVEERTRHLEGMTVEMANAMEKMEAMQAELVKSEKLASLGRMVAGVAHEVNTPLGNAMLVASALGHRTKEALALISEGKMKRASLESFKKYSEEGEKSLEMNLQRAAELVSNFKQVAADQSRMVRRRFDLKQSCEEVIFTMAHAARRRGIEINMFVPVGIELDSYPGALSQVVVIMVSNALAHAFGDDENAPARSGGDGGDPPWFRLGAMVEGDDVHMEFEDNGFGIDKVNQPFVFDPFFTTKQGRGGTGLGLSIAHGIVTSVLGGKMELESWKWGTRFIVTFPKVAPIGAPTANPFSQCLLDQ